MRAALKLDKQTLEFETGGDTPTDGKAADLVAAAAAAADASSSSSAAPTTIAGKVRVNPYISRSGGRRPQPAQLHTGGGGGGGGGVRPRRQRIAMPLVPTSVLRLRPKPKVPPTSTPIRPTEKGDA
jgi:hypothetical protein